MKRRNDPDGSHARVTRRATRAPGWWRTTLGLLLVLGAALSAGAFAQGMLEGEVRIGVILPAGQGGDDPLADAMARAAAQGAEMADDEFAFNAEMLGIDFAVVTAEASGADAVTAAARTLVEEAGAFGVVGGFDAAEAAALATWSAASGVPYMNVGSSADVLRNEQCQPTMFHVEPSAAMYLDAMAGWYVRSGLRNWYFVRDDTEESGAQLARIQQGLRERHFGAQSVGERVVDVAGDAAGLDSLAQDVTRSRADLVVLLLPAAAQLTVLTALEEAGLDLMVTGFPYPEAETRTFYAASREAAPNLGTGHRISSWEATLDAYGARELNARYRQTYGEPMDASAWSVYQGVKILYEAAFFGGTTEAESVLAYLENPQAVFDVWKGIGTTFRPWDGQLRQSLYLAKIDATAEDLFTLASLVGELPAIYMPGTDPVERLDQIGQLAAASACQR